MKKYLIKTIAIALILNCGIAFGQSRQEKKEQLEAMKVSQFTQKLDLTPQEAAVFWPVYNQYEDELKALRKKHKEDKNKLDDLSGMSDAEVEKLVDGKIIFRQEELEITKKYHAQFKKILPIKKVALLYKAQEDFKRDLIKLLKEKGNKPKSN